MTVEIKRPYIKLIPLVPKRMRFDLWHWEDIQITDPKTRIVKPIRAMVLHVTEEDGQKVDTTYSTVSIKHQTDLAALIDTGMLFVKAWTIILNPRDRATEYTIGPG